jgi:hypothetical protein
MSLLNEASFLVTPNGYKEDKLYAAIPTNGNGDMTFTRTGTATRVNAAGLVELVPYNLLLRSQEFKNDIFVEGRSEVDSNTATAPDGTLTADTWRGDGISGIHSLAQTVSATSGVAYTQSVFAKKGTNNFLQIVGATTIYAGTSWVNFDLEDGAVGEKGASATATITDFGNGWYRCTMTATATATASGNGFSLRLITSADSERAETNSLATSVYLWGAQVVEGSSALTYQKTVDGEDIPRIDYTGGGCPSILLEPERTNYAKYSQQFDVSETWTQLNSPTITPNTHTAPDGTFTACTFTAGAASAQIQQLYTTGTSGVSYTGSVYIKRLFGSGNVRIRVSENDNITITVTSDWTRVSFTATSTTSNQIRIGFNISTIGDSVAIWGAQLEEGAYPTSYIPTTTGTSTRIADAVSKTGISDLIGQTEGTVFMDINWEEKSGVYFINSISNGSTSDEIYMSFGNSLNNSIRFSITSGGVSSVSKNSNELTSGRYKIAFAYANNDATAYINGAPVFTDSFVSVPSTDQMKFLRANNSLGYSGTINACALWKTRLKNEELESLTTI